MGPQLRLHEDLLVIGPDRPIHPRRRLRAQVVLERDVEVNVQLIGRRDVRCLLDLLHPDRHPVDVGPRQVRPKPLQERSVPHLSEDLHDAHVAGRHDRHRAHQRPEHQDEATGDGRDRQAAPAPNQVQAGPGGPGQNDQGRYRDVDHRALLSASIVYASTGHGRASRQRSARVPWM